MKHNRNPLYSAMKFALAAGFATTFAGTSGALFAQDADEDDAVQLEKMPVTGSRIKRTDIEGFSPVTVITRQDLERSGLTDIGDLLRELPSVTGGALTTQSNNPGFTSGATTVDIRGMGTVRTLVLINGRRLVDGGDLANIPFSVIERIDVLKEGASAIYGADAVAGVVNIITRREFEGAEVSVGYSQFTELNDFTVQETGALFKTKDGSQYNGSLLFGARSDRGGFTAAVDFNKQNPIFQGEVNAAALQGPLYVNSTSDGFYQVGSSFIPQGRFDVDCDGDGVRENVLFDPSGSGSTICDNTNYRPYIGGGPNNDTYNYAPVNFVQRPFERRSFYFTGDYDLMDNVNVFMETRFTSRSADRKLAPLPYGPLIGNPGAPLTTITADDPDIRVGAVGVAFNNAYNPFGQDIFDVRRRMVETAGGRRFLGEVNQLDFVLGARGDLGDRWDYEVSYSYGRRTSDSTVQGQFFGTFLAAALGPSFFQTDDNGNQVMGSDGRPLAVCGTEANPIAAINGVPCVPLDLFNGPGTITQNMLNFIGISTSSRLSTRLDVLNATVTGDIVELPAGPLSAAFGVERRDTKREQFRDSGIQAGAVTGNSGGNTNGQYDVDSLFGEVSIPILADAPMAQLLDASIGFRYDDYSTVGSNSTFQGGIRWQPISGLLVRGSYAEVFREPNVLELFSASNEGFPGARDPCRANGGTGGIGCQGLPAFNQDDGQVRAITGGNANLRPEEGDTVTLGVAWSPEFLPGFSMTLDWWNVDLESTISTLTAQAILTTCANSGNLCDTISRLPNGKIDKIQANTQNFGRMEREGIDYNFRYTKDSSFGLWTFNFLATQLLTAETTPFEGFESLSQNDGLLRGIPLPRGAAADSPPAFQPIGVSTIDQVGFIDIESGLNTNADPFPEWKVSFSADWAMGNWGASYKLTWFDDLKYQCAFACFGEAFDLIEFGDFNGDNAPDLTPLAVPGSNPQGLQADGIYRYDFITVDSVAYHDLFLSYNFDFGTKLTFGVTNVTNEKPEVVDRGNANTLPELWRIAGRQFLIRATHTF